MTVWRWQEDTTPGTPDGNMAADARLLQEVQSGAAPAVRAYTWDRPSVSIGRLQDEAAVRSAYPDLPLVRRPTGGRAVCHGDDLCLSVAARLSDLPPLDSQRVLASYLLLAGALLDAFGAVGVPARFGSDACPLTGQASVDCFAAIAPGDLVDARTGHKLAGCAQRREGTALLQQMSIPHLPAPPAAFLAHVRHSLTLRLAVTDWSSN